MICALGMQFVTCGEDEHLNSRIQLHLGAFRHVAAFNLPLTSLHRSWSSLPRHRSRASLWRLGDERLFRLRCELYAN